MKSSWLKIKINECYYKCLMKTNMHPKKKFQIWKVNWRKEEKLKMEWGGSTSSWRMSVKNWKLKKILQESNYWRRNILLKHLLENYKLFKQWVATRKMRFNNHARSLRIKGVQRRRIDFEYVIIVEYVDI